MRIQRSWYDDVVFYYQTWQGLPYFLVILIVCCFTPSQAQATTILISHPRAEVLQDIWLLQEKQLLQAPELRYVGFVHKQDKEEYQDAMQWIASNHLQHIFKLIATDCQLPEPGQWQSNCNQDFAPIIEQADGFLFFGGPDIPPSYYNQPTHLRTIIENPIRHRLELALLRSIFLPIAQQPAIFTKRPNRPFLAICLGMQSLNVALGGSLYQDIPTLIYGLDWLEEAHQLPPTSWHINWHSEREGSLYQPRGIMHPILLLDQHAWLAPKAQTIPQQHSQLHLQPQVLSVHHQAIHRLAEPLYPLATSIDQKIIEAVGHHQFPHVLGVQFHPERHYLWRAAAKESTHAGFFNQLQQHAPSLQFHHHVWQYFSTTLQSQTRLASPPQHDGQPPTP